MDAMVFYENPRLTEGDFENKKLIVESGTSYIMIPKNDLKIFM